MLSSNSSVRENLAVQEEHIYVGCLIQTWAVSEQPLVHILAQSPKEWWSGPDQGTV